MLKLKEVTKKYGSKVVLDKININFDNPVGVYGILGRNGVGKTTLMKIIVNMITKYEGEIEMKDQPVKNNDDVLQHIVYVGGEIYKNNSQFQGKIKHLIKAYGLMYQTFDTAYAEFLLESFNIKRKDKFAKLSTGNKTLVQNILGLATRAPITIMDEPTNGLDSVNRQNFFHYMMEDYAEHPRLFMLSTHLIQEVENYLTDVIILKDAEVLIDDTLTNIQAKAQIVKNGHLEQKHVIKESAFGPTTSQYIYDELSEDEIEQIKQDGGEIEALDLQDLFNALVEK